MAGDATTKDFLLEVLGQKWPLSARELFNLMKKTKGLTYQAVHKNLAHLAGVGVLVKSGLQYAINPKYVQRQRIYWTEVARNYERAAEEKRGIIIGKQVVMPTAVHTFGEREITVRAIPSVFISRSTVNDLIEAMDRPTLDKIARRVAEKDRQFIQNHMMTEEESAGGPLAHLKKLNELANDFYWGDVEFKTLGNGDVQIRIRSETFHTPKGKFFYDKIYEHFMNALGYGLKKRNELETTYVYAKTKTETRSGTGGGRSGDFEFT